MPEEYTGTTKEEAILGLTMKACKICCRGASGGGSIPIEFTDCRCAYPYELFVDGDPQPPENPPPQPAGGFFPTILYYQTDLDGAGCDCWTTVAPGGDACLGSINFVTLTTATTVSYCSRSVNIPLYFCEFVPSPSPGHNHYESEEIPLCDITMTFSNDYVITIRRFMIVHIDTTCAECVTIDETWLSDNGLDETEYASWIGLQYCTAAAMHVHRYIYYRAISLTVPATVTSVECTTSFGGSQGLLYDSTTPYSYGACQPGRSFITATGGRILFVLFTGITLIVCTNTVLDTANGLGDWDQVVYCCDTNDFDHSITSACCAPTNEKLQVPGEDCP